MTPSKPSQPVPHSSRRAAATTRTRSAAIVADLEQEIVERGWPIGEVIGHEAQLMERFDVSRSVLREAIRTLESSGVVTVRTGRGGGLVVTEPRAEAVALAASLYLDYTGFEPAQLFRTWLVVESALMDIAVETATDDELLELRECQRADAKLGVEGIEQSSFIERLAGLAENPILALFFLITRDLAMVHGLEMTPSAAAWFARQYGEMADALVERDAEQARAILERFLRRLEDTGSVVVRRRRRQ